MPEAQQPIYNHVTRRKVMKMYDRAGLTQKTENNPPPRCTNHIFHVLGNTTDIKKEVGHTALFKALQ